MAATPRPGSIGQQSQHALWLFDELILTLRTLNSNANTPSGAKAKATAFLIAINDNLPTPAYRRTLTEMNAAIVDAVAAGNESLNLT